MIGSRFALTKRSAYRTGWPVPIQPQLAQRHFSERTHMDTTTQTPDKQHTPTTRPPLSRTWRQNAGLYRTLCRHSIHSPQSQSTSSCSAISHQHASTEYSGCDTHTQEKLQRRSALTADTTRPSPTRGAATAPHDHHVAVRHLGVLFCSPLVLCSCRSQGYVAAVPLMSAAVMQAIVTSRFYRSLDLRSLSSMQRPLAVVLCS